MPTVPEQLQAEFAENEARTLERLADKERKQARTATLAGGMAGLTAVLLTVTVTRRELFWHSFLLEALLSAAAGWGLVRLHGGTLKGIVLFAAAYLLAFFLRAVGLDPSVVFAPHLQGSAVGR